MSAGERRVEELPSGFRVDVRFRMPGHRALTLS